MKSMLRYLSIFGCIVLTGCHIPASIALRGVGGRSSYNEALQLTSNEQILLNLIRLRYCDTPYFLNVSSITTQFQFDAGLTANVPVPGLDEKNPYRFGGDFHWKNQPTISYSPLEGKQFVEHLLQPLDLSLLQQLVYSGWDVDRIFRLTVQGFDNIYNIPLGAGPTPETQPQYKKFFEITSLMRELQIRGQLQLGVTNIEEDGKSIPVLQVAFLADSEEAEKLAEMLKGIQRSGDFYVLHLKVGFDNHAELGVLTRSVLSCMYYLSLGIDIPAAHDDIVIQSYTESGVLFKWNNVLRPLIHVYSSKKMPHDAYLAVKYNGYWFYIEQTDINSKKTFSLLQGIYSLQAGGKGQSTVGPLLSLPLL